VKTIDLFAGIGGIRLGFEQAAADLKVPLVNVFTSEINPQAINTYRANFGNEPIHGDISQINVTDIPGFEILLAGFPCQPFSQAGLKKGLEDDRGQLFFEVLRILKEHQPKAFLLENVKQLRSHNKGETLSIMLDSLKKIGYTNLHTTVLRARDFGIPQNRERLFIVGFLNPTVEFQFPTGTQLSTRLGDILENNVSPKYTISDRLWAGHQKRKENNKKNGKGFGYSLFNSESSHANTISARYYKDGSEILIDQPDSNPRKVTPREAARLQGFPDTFVISSSDTQAYIQFGNSVAVPVIKAIATEILSSLS
jgi:DNA (cytosine-5)-methyltransferase 1